MHNLKTVFNFEFMRAIKKKTFWIGALSMPVIMAVIFGINFAASKTTSDTVEQMKTEKFSLVVTDESKLVAQPLLDAFGAQTSNDKATGIADVQNGKTDAYFYYPADLTQQPVEVYAKDTGIFNNSKYDSIAKSLLQESVSGSVNDAVKIAIQGNFKVALTTYKDGAQFDTIKSMIVPGIFLVLFYFVIAMFGNQMLNSTVEEKENRVIEMLLTSVNTRTLIIGKILALIILSLVQVLLIVLPTIVLYLLFKDSLALPGLDLSSLTFDWVSILTSLAIFALSFLLFTGLLVAIGAAVPTAKEAGPFMGTVMILLFGPLYAVTLFVSNPEAGIIQFLSYFPLTAPISLLLRNAVGNLQPHETIIALSILLVSTIFVINLAVRIFRYGALEYSRKLSLKEIFGRS